MTERFSTLAQAGFYLQILILASVIASLATQGNKIVQLVSSMLGYISLAWFGFLIFGRYDHFGKVCSGDFVTDLSKTTYTNLQLAGQYTEFYLLGVGAIVVSMFLIVLLYSCCVDPTKKVAEDEEKD